MRAASNHLSRGIAELRALRREMERHPDYAKSKAGRQAGRPFDEWATLAWWIHNSIDSVLLDVPVDDASMALVDDAFHLLRHLRQFGTRERRDLARFAAAA